MLCHKQEGRDMMTSFFKKGKERKPRLPKEEYNKGTRRDVFTVRPLRSYIRTRWNSI